MGTVAAMSRFLWSCTVVVLGCFRNRFVDFLRVKFLKISLVNEMKHKWHGIVVIYLV